MFSLRVRSGARHYTRGVNGHDERDLLLELFPETARELFGEPGGRSHEPSARRATLGLFPVADGKLAVVHGDRLLELDPIEPAGKNAVHCDLCHVTRSRSEVGIYRAELAPRVFVCHPLSEYPPLSGARRSRRARRVVGTAFSLSLQVESGFTETELLAPGSELSLPARWLCATM